MLSINSVPLLKKINFKSSNTAANTQPNGNPQKATTLTELVYKDPMKKIGYVAGAGALLGLISGLAVTKNIKTSFAYKLTGSLLLSTKFALGLPIFYIILATGLKLLDSQKDRLDSVDRTLKFGKYRHDSIFETKTSQP